MEKNWSRFSKVQNSCRVEIPKFPGDKFPKTAKSIVEKNWSNKSRFRPKPRSRTTRTGSKTGSRSSLPGKPKKEIAEKRSPTRSKIQKVKGSSCKVQIFQDKNLAIKFGSHFFIKLNKFSNHDFARLPKL